MTKAQAASPFPRQRPYHRRQVVGPVSRGGHCRACRPSPPGPIPRQAKRLGPPGEAVEVSPGSLHVRTTSPMELGHALPERPSAVFSSGVASACCPPSSPTSHARAMSAKRQAKSSIWTSRSSVASIVSAIASPAIARRQSNQRHNGTAPGLGVCPRRHRRPFNASCFADIFPNDALKGSSAVAFLEAAVT